MRRALRSSLSLRLLAGGLLLVAALIVAISAFLIVSRDRQTGDQALSNSDNRAAVLRQLLQRYTAASSSAAVRQLAGDPALAAALTSADPAGAVREVLQGPGLTGSALPGEALLVVTRGGAVAYLSPLPPGLEVPTPGLPSVVAALRGHDASGLELIGGGTGYDTATPMFAGGQVVGAVAYLAPLADQVQRFGPLITFPGAVILADTPTRVLRIRSTTAAPAVGTAPAAITEALQSGADHAHAIYSAPLPSGGYGDVAGSFDAIATPGGAGAEGYVGVEAPLSSFTGDQRGDEVTVALLALAALLTTGLAILVFVERFVRRPVALLDAGVARIAAGDLATDVDLHSEDELGRLARGVNIMRGRIARQVHEIEASHAQLDASVERLGRVSRALTTTTAGVDALHAAVVDAAASLAHDGVAFLYVSDGLSLRGRAASPPDAPIPTLGAAAETMLLAGEAPRRDAPTDAGAATVAVPMFYQDAVVGAVAVRTAAGVSVSDSDMRSLQILANNGAIALENTRLFEQERETVSRLRELGEMKSNFLAMVQHELRTPLTAVVGMADLLQMCWDTWDDAAKLDALRDVQVAARTLFELVETMIDYSLLEADTLGLQPQPASLRAAVEQAVVGLADRARDGLGVTVRIDVDDDVQVFADPQRLQQVMRAVLDNAVKFSPEGSEVAVHATREGRQGMVRVDVIDSGIGIPSEALPRVFDRFYQVDNSLTRRYGGVGMGLALVQRLAEAHGARVEVESAVGRGTRVSLHWPAVATASAGEARRAVEAKVAR